MSSVCNRRLLRDDQSIKNLPNRDARDLARQASVTASAEKDKAKAELVIDGYTRDIPDKRGDPVEVHQWAAPVSDGNPAWIELKWSRPQRVSQVQITFDTGFRRQLTLTAQNSTNVGIKRAAQPETVKDYVRHRAWRGWREACVGKREGQFSAAESAQIRRG